MHRPFVSFVLAVFVLCAGAFVPQRHAPASTGPSALVARVATVLVARPAAAQQRRARKKSLMSILFGRREVRRRAVRKRAKVRRRATRRTKKRKTKRRAVVKRKAVKRRTVARKTPRKRKKVRRAAAVAAPAAAGATAAAAVTRDDATPAVPLETKTVLVVGDFYGGGLAFGLTRALGPETGIRILKRTTASSGLIRDDVVDWPKRIGELAAETDPDYIVVQLGSNDRQLLKTNEGKFKPRSTEWDTVYKARIGAVANALKATGKPFLWVGVPPVRFKSMNRDFLVFNEWYGEAAKGAGGKFVDVWDGFTDADGNYARSGPDVNGRIVVLRGKDGINMTTRGKDKLAYYATATLQKALEGPVVPTDLLAATPGGTAAEPKEVYDPSASGRTIVVKLNDPTLDGASGLAGAGALQLPKPVVADSVPNGRADDFSWPATK